MTFPVLVAVALLAQEPPAPSAPSAPKPEGVKPAPSSEPEIKPYDRVITKDAKSKAGLFKVHEVKGKHFFEIPAAELGMELLWVSQFKTTTLGAGYGGTEVGNRVVRFERRDKRVLLRGVTHATTAKDGDPIQLAVRAANEHPILMAFNIEALGPGDAPVIDVTRLFTSDLTEFSPRTQLRAAAFDATRTFIDRILAFPTNINAEVTQTFTSPPPSPNAPPSPAPSLRPGSATVVIAYSLVKLPEKPMLPREFDDRLGYFNLRQQEFSTPEHGVEEKRYIVRWRLEKKDPAAAISEPVKPITYYVDPATPEKWRKWVKLGVEDWKPAFEAAGFRNGIICLDPPNDPEWSPEDARYSVIRWLPSTIQNAYGPNIHDPRTGEILEADVKIYHNVLLLLRNWYFAQVSPLDARAKKLPLDDSLMGELLRFVVAHEVGHTLGLPHNFKASGMYTVAQVRDKNWVKKNSHTPTIMDYSRFNYVAQPEDGIAVGDLIPKLGPYDLFSIMWGYKPIPGAKSSEDEKPTLDEWLKPQETTPYLRFSLPYAMGADPTDQTEAVAESDPVEATRLGTRNIQRVMGYLVDAVAKKGDDYSELSEMYGTVLGQWARELNHVAVVVGGIQAENKHNGQPGGIYAPIERAKQRQALEFLQANLFVTPQWAVRTDIAERIEYQGMLSRILNLQTGVLRNLMAPAKLQRMSEHDALYADKAYSPSAFLSDLRAGLFKELDAPQPAVDAFRRNLQRAFLELANERLNRPLGPQFQGGPIGGRPLNLNANDDIRGLLRTELRRIGTAAGTKAAAAKDPASRAHLEDLRDQTARILDPKLAPATPAGSPFRPAFDWTESHMGGPLGCWPAFRIEP